jgi:hypothetical protein
MQFAFRWMNCLLMRELTMGCTIRMWDTYLVRPLYLLSSLLPSRALSFASLDRVRKQSQS